MTMNRWDKKKKSDWLKIALLVMAVLILIELFRIYPKLDTCSRLVENLTDSDVCVVCTKLQDLGFIRQTVNPTTGTTIPFAPLD